MWIVAAQNGRRGAAGAALDVLLTDAAVGNPIQARPASRDRSRGPRCRSGACRTAWRAFADPAWEKNWFYRRLAQVYLAAGQTADSMTTRTSTGAATRSRGSSPRTSTTCWRRRTSCSEPRGAQRDARPRRLEPRQGRAPRRARHRRSPGASSSRRRGIRGARLHIGRGAGHAVALERADACGHCCSTGSAITPVRSRSRAAAGIA